MGTTLVGDPDVAINGIKNLLELSGGGFGGIMFRAHEWANREQTMRSYELFARYVMPHFQGSLDTLYASNKFTKENRVEVVGRNVEAVRRAFTDTGREVPDAYRDRTLGAMDMDPEKTVSRKKKVKEGRLNTDNHECIGTEIITFTCFERDLDFLISQY
jgi:limonene 1,2-monooxygenase